MELVHSCSSTGTSSCSGSIRDRSMVDYYCHRWIPMKLWKLHQLHERLRLMRCNTLRLPLHLIRYRQVILIWLDDRNRKVYQSQPHAGNERQWLKQLTKEDQREQRAQQAHCQLGPSLLNGPLTQDILLKK